MRELNFPAKRSRTCRFRRGCCPICTSDPCPTSCHRRVNGCSRSKFSVLRSARSSGSSSVPWTFWSLDRLWPHCFQFSFSLRLPSSWTAKEPVIFRQRRKGFNGKEFVMLKFRTMRVQEDGPVVVQATREDPRVTSIGRFLRAASIDELPQLLNVLRGEMSLIGPRPHALAHDSYFEKILEGYAFRHHVKPGLTGWAQCNGSRGATPTVEDIAERVKLDLWYVNNWSLWLDVQILIKTFFEVARKRNAY